MNNLQISQLPHHEWVEYKRQNRDKLLNKYPNYDFDSRFEIMLKFKEIVEDEGLTLLLANGTLLGAVREKDFIEWDDDVDMDILAEEFVPKFETIRDRLLELGYIVRAIPDYPKMKINVYNKGEKVGILAIYKSEKFYHRGPYRWPLEVYENLEEIEFRGTKFKTPKIDEYIEHQYGKNWKTPKRENYLSEDVFR
jgi:phosphorylcholine metabolism protein LicD|tara:strand:- start:278 stop:862 length:585 start_codon:yes stop_codon:yes gene_type:complete